MKTEPGSGNNDARYEFRTFGQDFAMAAYRMARLSEPVPEKFWQRHSHETYLVCAGDNRHNIKIRDGALDIKFLIDTSGTLEQWSPILKVGFPILEATLEKDVITRFPCKFPQLDRASFTEHEFLGIAKQIPDLHVVDVRKERHGYKVGGTICEVASVLVNGARLSTISVESTDVEDIAKTLTSTGLSDFENINYIQAIQRVLGLSESPFVN